MFSNMPNNLKSSLPGSAYTSPVNPVFSGAIKVSSIRLLNNGRVQRTVVVVDELPLTAADQDDLRVGLLERVGGHGGELRDVCLERETLDHHGDCG